MMLSLQERLPYLRQVSMFAGLEPAHLEGLAEIAEERFYPSGATIAQVGDPGKELFMIVSGVARLLEESRAGQAVELGLLQAGQVFAEMAIITPDPLLYSLQAVEDVHLLAIQRARFEEMLSDKPHIALAVMRALAARTKEDRQQAAAPDLSVAAPSTRRADEGERPIERWSEDRLLNYIPKELLAKFEAARAAGGIESERRIVTILFSDVKGSTAMAEQLDPEEWAEIMNGAFEYLIPPIYRYEGTVVRLMGDAILAFFGAPIAHEDDPQRAVRAGLEIVAGIGSYRQKVVQEYGLDFDVRVGINTGLVVVGEVGSHLRSEYTAMGDPINLAARMEQTAEPGTVQISHDTYQLVASLFAVEPLGSIVVKGRSQPVKTYRVTGLMAEPERTRRAFGLEAPLIGRRLELSTLQGALSNLRQGQGQIVCLVGEAGLGKSRLIAELRSHWEATTGSGQQTFWSELRAVSHGLASPYEQFRQHLLDFASILESDPPEVVRAKLVHSLAYAGPAVSQRAISVYTVLLGLAEAEQAGGAGSASPLAGEAFQRELYDVVLTLQRSWANGKTGVLVLDDLHWIDPASTGLLVHLFQLAEELPVMFLCAFRPDPLAPSWQIKQAAEGQYAHRYTKIELHPLPPQESERLLAHLLGFGEYFPDLLAQILQKAEGNPLFIEEVVRSLIDKNMVERTDRGVRWVGPADSATPAITIPGSLQALLQARLDLLTDSARRTLQSAAVIGRSFTYQVLRAIAAPHDGLDRELPALIQAGLISPVTDHSQGEYFFRQGFIQEVAYHSILLKRRRQLHLQVGETLEVLFAGRLEDHSALLGHHFYQAGDVRARRYYRLAGAAAARLGAFQQTQDYLSRALEVSAGASPVELIEIREARAEALFYLGLFAPASADLEAALQLARQGNLATVECRVLATMALFLWYKGQTEESIVLARQAEALAKNLEDTSVALRAALVLATAIQNKGDLLEAHTRMRQVLAASRSQKEHSIMALSLQYLAMQYVFMGRFTRAVACARQARALSLRYGNQRWVNSSYYFESQAEGSRGEYDAALEALETGRALDDKINNPWLARYPNQRAWLCAELGDWETAYEFDYAGLQQAKGVPGFREFEISTLLNLVLDCTALGRLEEAGHYLAESQYDLDRPEFGMHTWRWRTRLVDAQARLFLARSQPGQAAEAVAGLFNWADRTQARKYQARGLILQARLDTIQGDLPLAMASLHAARDLADRIGYFPACLEARQRLAHLSAAQGDQALARRLQGEAARLIAELDRRLKHPDLRQSFQRGLSRQIPGWP